MLSRVSSSNSSSSTTLSGLPIDVNVEGVSLPYELCCDDFPVEIVGLALNSELVLELNEYWNVLESSLLDCTAVTSSVSMSEYDSAGNPTESSSSLRLNNLKAIGCAVGSFFYLGKK
ncbi:hypothetical protein OGAPHI_006134 [Ogataea philodendri]|uniref:Uncharacterized protein n=1 Tax=Ogataea philodendri TaxID=1378263 RepID=A0A9P8T1H5_9ASCO|nr:uncharacterized protein OGAPHI_006134 [Ogataea philodendri]KAH3661955.1 hypothetical protein OGAPHI_006134 [Ogataea philodendri]